MLFSALLFLKFFFHQGLLLLHFLEKGLEGGVLGLEFVVLAENLEFFLAGLLGSDLEFSLESGVELGGAQLFLLDLLHVVEFSLHGRVVLLEFSEPGLLFCQGGVFGLQFVDDPV